MASNVPSGQAQPQAVALFVSDVHLQESLPKTTAAFLDFLNTHAAKAQRLYLLGDLFEYWAGDDDIGTPYHQRIVEALRKLSDAGVQLFWLPGNRDFLVGDEFVRAIGATALQEPHIATIAGRRIVIVHGDAQCTDDADYMAFRKQVRDPAWQKQFLSMPLPQRKAIIESLREQSRNAQRGKAYEIMDVNQDAITGLFDTSGTTLMIHGHTHRPARHTYPHAGGQCERHVLPDWDCDCASPRGGWIAVTADGSIERIYLDASDAAS
jgi:UDP-2,3-diacylglucosamine hydrolase